MSLICADTKVLQFLEVGTKETRYCPLRRAYFTKWVTPELTGRRKIIKMIPTAHISCSLADLSTPDSLSYYHF